MTDWEKVPQTEIVCGCANVTKRDIVRAIAAGAETFEAICDATGAGKGHKCAELNPRGRCCHGDIRELLAAYGPALERMKGGCSCGGG